MGVGEWEIWELAKRLEATMARCVCTGACVRGTGQSRWRRRVRAFAPPATRHGRLVFVPRFFPSPESNMTLWAQMFAGTIKGDGMIMENW